MLPYVDIVAAGAAVLLAVLGLTAKGLPPSRRVIMAVLTVIAVGGPGVSHWMSEHKTAAAAAERDRTREHLGFFIAQGEQLKTEIEAETDQSDVYGRIDDWAKRTESFLNTLGPSFVVRFRSDAGMDGLMLVGAHGRRGSYWKGLRNRLTRLNEFSDQFAK